MATADSSEAFLEARIGATPRLVTDRLGGGPTHQATRSAGVSDSGSGWFATPSLHDSFIRHSMPVHPGANQAKPPAPQKAKLCGTVLQRPPGAP